MAKPSTLLDKVGAVAGTVCAVHCLLTGIAMGFLAVMGFGFLADPWVEAGFFGMAAVVGVWALVHGVRVHHSYLPALVFVAGVACIVLAHLLGHELAHSGPSGMAPYLAALGGLLIAAFHWANMRLQHRGCGCALEQKRAPESAAPDAG